MVAVEVHLAGDAALLLNDFDLASDNEDDDSRSRSSPSPLNQEAIVVPVKNYNLMPHNYTAGSNSIPRGDTVPMIRTPFQHFSPLANLAPR
jgi:hypothetical protein